MTRSEAIARVLGRGLPGVTKRNAHFASINAAKDVWWLDIPVEKLSENGASNISLLLYDDKSDTLYVLLVPTCYFKDNQGQLVTRPTRHISIELSAESSKMFRDVRPGGDQSVEFSRFLIDTLRSFSAGGGAPRADHPPVLRKRIDAEQSASAKSLSVDELADLRRKLTVLLNSLDSAIGTQGEGVRRKINRLSHDGGPIPRAIAALMATITEMRNSAEYESKVLSAAECAAVRHSWQAIQEWAESASNVKIRCLFVRRGRTVHTGDGTRAGGSEHP